LTKFAVLSNISFDRDLDYCDKAPIPFNGKSAQVRVQYLGSIAEVKEEKRQTDVPVTSED
jgi:hypothetical protein